MARPEIIPQLALIATRVQPYNDSIVYWLGETSGDAAVVHEPSDADGEFWFGDEGEYDAPDGDYYKTLRGVLNRAVRYLRGKQT